MPGTLGRVLVVDDSEPIRRLIRVNLELEGFEVVTASDGQEALDLLHGQHLDVDLVTLDAVMPGLDGFTVAERLRAHPATRDLPIAMVTASAQGADVEHGERIGVDAYLTKPFDPAHLVRLARRLTGHQES